MWKNWSFAVFNVDFFIQGKMKIAGAISSSAFSNNKLIFRKSCLFQRIITPWSGFYFLRKRAIFFYCLLVRAKNFGRFMNSDLTW